MVKQFKKSFTINSIQDLIAVLQVIDKQESNNEMWFRGQINSDWFLEPNVMRNQIPINGRCSHVIKGPCIPNNNYLLPNCYYHEYLEKLKEYANKANFSTENDLEVLAFVQHHKGITPLLDWSEDPLVAL